MNLRTTVLALIIFILLAAPGLAVTYKSSDGALALSASRIDVTSNALTATGKAHIHWADVAAKTVLDANAEKMVIAMMPELASGSKAASAKGAKSRMVIKSAVLTGPVKMTYISTDASGKSTVTANADNADFDGISNLAHLTGNVKIVNDNPAMFSAPATMSGDKATLNLKPSGPDDFRFRVETSPGVSTITATPKPAAPKEEKKADEAAK